MLPLNHEHAQLRSTNKLMIYQKSKCAITIIKTPRLSGVPDIL